MKRNQNSKFRVQKLIVLGVIFSFCILNFAFCTLTFAQESSPSSTLQQKIQAIQQEVASKAAALKGKVNKELANKMAAGQVIENTKLKIVITTLNSNSRGSTNSQTIVVNEYTEFFNTLKKTKNTQIKASDIATGDFIVALGDMDDQGNLIAKRVLISTKPELKKTISWGTVSDVTSNDFGIKTQDHQAENFLINRNTGVMIGTEDATLSDIKSNRLVAVSSSLDEKNQNIAGFVYVIPQGILLNVDKKQASAEGIATKSAIKTDN